MRPTSSDTSRARLAALVRAMLIAAVMLAALPMAAAAADDQPSLAPSPSIPGDGGGGGTSDGTIETLSEDASQGDDPPADPTAEPTPTPDPSADPTPTPEPTVPIRSVLFYHPSAVVRQYGRTWCVAAATQTMWNIIVGSGDARYARQKTLYQQIRHHNRYRYHTLGNDVAGWAWALRRYTGMAYHERSFASKNAAIAEIAASLDRTGHPVGITINHGRHAWVVLGYKSRPDPLNPTRHTVLGFFVSGPLGAHSSDPWKYEYLSMARFRTKYGKYHESQRKVVWEGRYVLVTD